MLFMGIILDFRLKFRVQSTINFNTSGGHPKNETRKFPTKLFQADFNCADELLDRDSNWKYFINLCGQDFPLKTGAEIASALKVMYPKNAIESVHMPPQKVSR